MESEQTRARGQVGIGTLIVFISMVLVAAVAAGVLINTAGYLQGKAESTGQQSSSQVTDRLQVVAKSGTAISEADRNVGAVNITVQKSPGSSNIDLENATIQWVGPSGTYNLVASTVIEPGADGQFRAMKFKDADESHPVLNDPDDRVVVSFDLGETDDVDGTPEFGQRIPEGGSIRLMITTKSGASTTVQLTVPQSVSGKSSVTL